MRNIYYKKYQLKLEKLYQKSKWMIQKKRKKKSLLKVFQTGQPMRHYRCFTNVIFLNISESEVYFSHLVYCCPGFMHESPTFEGRAQTHLIIPDDSRSKFFVSIYILFIFITERKNNILISHQMRMILHHRRLAYMGRVLIPMYL